VDKNAYPDNRMKSLCGVQADVTGLVIFHKKLSIVALGVHSLAALWLLITSYNCTTDNIDRLCQYFGCETGEVIVFIPAEGKNEV